MSSRVLVVKKLVKGRRPRLGQQVRKIPNFCKRKWIATFPHGTILYSESVQDYGGSRARGKVEAEDTLWAR